MWNLHAQLVDNVLQDTVEFGRGILAIQVSTERGQR